MQDRADDPAPEAPRALPPAPAAATGPKAIAAALVEPGYRDAHGRERTVDAAIVARLASALQSDGPDAAGDTPPPRTLVFRTGDPIRIPLPARPLQRWSLATEQGSRFSGSVPRAAASTAPPAGAAPGHSITLPDLDVGYHQLTLEPGPIDITVIVGPRTCWLPTAAGGGAPRCWGVSAQLYLLRSRRDWGIGDFTTLKTLVETVSARGADVVGLNPLHAMFPDRPEHASRYSPASRLLLNPLDIDVEAIPEAGACGELAAWMQTPAFRKAHADARDAALLDYTGVARLKASALRMVYRCFRDAATPERKDAFARFRRERGATFERHCLFLALQEHWSTEAGESRDWPSWPAPFQSPDSAEVATFARTSADAVTWQAWLQWVADEQLAAAAESARRGGMQIGLFRDLAVGADPAGAETWADPSGVVRSARIGAPPDLLNPQGQDWGLPPVNPLRLAQTGYRSFVELVRANMRHAGAIRIDHVMALQHLYWIPAGHGPDAGAYVTYPFEALLTVLAIESQRHRCVVIGEDLGTVPEGFRERLQANGILSYRVLFFERDTDDGFLAPDMYPVDALAVAGNHDLPLIRGWIEGRDIELAERLGRCTPVAADAARARRQREIQRLQGALAALQAPAGGGQTLHPDTLHPDTLHRYLARTPARLMLAQYEDLTGERDQVNLPASTSEHPNWQRRYATAVEAFAASSEAAERMAAIADLRPRAAAPGTSR